MSSASPKRNVLEVVPVRRIGQRNVRFCAHFLDERAPSRLLSFGFPKLGAHDEAIGVARPAGDVQDKRLVISPKAGPRFPGVEPNLAPPFEWRSPNTRDAA